MQKYTFLNVYILILTILTLKALSALQVTAVIEPAICGKLLLNNSGTTPQVLSSYLQITSQFLCAGLCFFKEPSCVTFHYFRINATCFMYGDSFKPLLGSHNEQVCQKAKFVNPTTTPIVTSATPSTTLSAQPTTLVATAAPVAPTWLNGCATSPTTYTHSGTICPALKNCTCNKGVSAVDVAVSSADLCYDKCATTANCLAFSYVVGYCRVAVATNQLSLVSSNTGFACSC